MDIKEGVVNINGLQSQSFKAGFWNGFFKDFGLKLLEIIGRWQMAIKSKLF